MDILYQLPFSKEVCSKIFMFACKSPHSGLGVSILKKNLQTIHLDIPEKDEDVIIFDVTLDEWTYYPYDIFIDIYYYTCFYNLTVINLYDTRVSGDIGHLKMLPKLTVINLSFTDIYGDIENLKWLPNLTEIFLSETGVKGNIEHLKSLPNLTDIYIDHTPVSGSMKAFHVYRKNTGMKKCFIIMG